MKVEKSSGQRVTGQGDDGHFIVRLDGTQVLSAEGLSSTDELK